MMFSIATSSYFMPRRARTIFKYSSEVCALARPTRLPFRSSTLLTPEPLRATIASGSSALRNVHDFTLLVGLPYHSETNYAPSEGTCLMRRMPSLRTILLGAASILLAAFLAAWIFLAYTKAGLAREFPPPGELVDIGGYRLHLHCLGTGRPTVVLEAGLNEFSLAWTQVQDETAKLTRVCAYDRAGFGWSDRGTLARTGANMVRELHALLGRARIEAPVVLVGHSFGGLLAREYVRAYPDEVAGLVLVDAVHEEYLERVPELKRGVQGGLRSFDRLSLIRRLG